MNLGMIGDFVQRACAMALCGANACVPRYNIVRDPFRVGSHSCFVPGRSSRGSVAS